MSTLEKLKALAVNQMRAGADLYDACESLERDRFNGYIDHDRAWVDSLRKGRYGYLERIFGLTPSKEENDLWDELMNQLT